jgi:hypothetical protein
VIDLFCECHGLWRVVEGIRYALELAS